MHHNAGCMKIKRNPFHLLLLNAFFLFFVSLFIPNKEIDIHFHDTYFILPIKYLIWFPTLVQFAFWIFYLTTKQYLFSNLLSWIHILLLLSTSLFTLFPTYFLFHFASKSITIPWTFAALKNLRSYQIHSDLVSSSFFVLIGCSLIYITNLIIGLLKGINRMKTN